MSLSSGNSDWQAVAHAVIPIIDLALEGISNRSPQGRGAQSQVVTLNYLKKKKRKEKELFGNHLDVEFTK